MPQLESIPKCYKRVGSKSSRPASVHLRSEDLETPFDFTFEAVRPNVFRTTFSSPSHPLPPFPSVNRPETDLKNVSMTNHEAESAKYSFDLGEIRASVDWQHAPVVSLGWVDSPTEPLHADLAFRSYVVDGSGVAHYTRHDRTALHVGLGEKAAPMDLTARHFQLSASDCFGYDASATDPLYKHVPLLVKATPRGCVALVSTSHARGAWAVGSEIDGLWGHFKVYRQDHGGLEEYVVVGRTLGQVVRSYAGLVGFPLLVPRWAYGYLSGGYKYTMGDDPPAHQQILDFVDQLRRHDIPCSAHQMSSGYSIAETEPKVRNVFTWNRHRFPDPEGWIAKCHSLGIRLLTNVKPFLLASHPDYQYLAENKGLFTDPRRVAVNDKGTAEMRLWSAGGGESGTGSHVDFTSAAAYEWWVRGVQKLKEQGVDAMWNDNNEYTLPNDDWEMSLETITRHNASGAKVGLWGRAMHTELMAKASYEGLSRVAPDERPFVLTRSASVGTLRYAGGSWSGDNVTSWASMKAANALSLNAGVSLMHCYGHDIGGFEGPQPTPELLLRWVRLGCHQIRFAINCFKTSPRDNQAGEVIEPWMYPEITPSIRDAVKRRYEMMPYIYSLGLQSHLAAVPPQRWVGWGYEADPEVWSSQTLKNGEEQYWFGDTLLVGGVYEPRVDHARLYLPRSASNDGRFDYGYVNLNPPHDYLASGQWVTVSSPWRDNIPLLAKIGGAIPVGRNVQTRMPGEKTPPNCRPPLLPEDDYRGVEIFPPRGTSHGTTFSTTWYEDDGLSSRPDISAFTVSYSSTDEKVAVAVTPHADNVFVPPWIEEGKDLLVLDVVIILPHGDQRYVEHAAAVVGGAQATTERLEPRDCGRVRYRLSQVLPPRPERRQEPQRGQGQGQGQDGRKKLCNGLHE
jgi:alpha-glucosidase (family GH31 glycosyl hydrolase)